MKLRLSLMAVAIAVAIVVALSNAPSGVAQENDLGPPSGEGRGYVGGEMGYGNEPVRVKQKMIRGATSFEFGRHMHVGPSDEIRQAAEAVVEARTAADDEVKAQATEKLTGLLEEYFEHDMQRREQELQEVETRLQKLRSQLQRRREMKDEIVDLQIKVVVNEAEGLGFFGAPGGYPGQPWEFGSSAVPRPSSPKALGLELRPARPSRPTGEGPRGERPREIR